MADVHLLLHVVSVKQVTMSRVIIAVIVVMRYCQVVRFVSMVQSVSHVIMVIIWMVHQVCRYVSNVHLLMDVCHVEIKAIVNFVKQTTIYPLLTTFATNAKLQYKDVTPVLTR